MTEVLRIKNEASVLASMTKSYTLHRFKIYFRIANIYIKIIGWSQMVMARL